MENTENSFIPPPLPVSTQLTTSPTISIPSPEWCICQGTYDEPTLIHLYYPKIHSSYLELNLSVAHPMHLGKSVARLHHHRIIQGSFTVLRILCAPSIHLFLYPHPLATSNLFMVCIVLLFPEWHIVGIIWCNLYRLASFTQ